MNDSEKSLSSSDYRVDFDNKVAYGIFYIDSDGRLDFVFEIGDKPNLVFLDKRALVNNKLVDAVDTATRSRVSVSLTRIKEFLTKKGYFVEIF